VITERLNCVRFKAVPARPFYNSVTGYRNPVWAAGLRAVERTTLDESADGRRPLVVLSSVLRRVREDLCNRYEVRFRKENV